ncbi:MAG TPA: carboxyl transferase domain-containing protein [Thermoleophilaceae bacterium]|nr:carboxyl transferase domain-containing protein [Thermoleophilaceae bacterium]
MTARLALVDGAPAVGSPAARLDARGRLEALCDPGSLEIVRSEVGSRSERRTQPGDGVVAGAGAVAGRPVFCFAQDASFAGGSLGAAQADSIVRVMRMAAAANAPIVAFVESAGARIDEGIAALAGYGQIFREQVQLSGWAPQIAVVCGASAGGGAYSPALSDFVVMTPGAQLFLTGPGVVREVMGEDVGATELGGPGVQSRNGVCHLVADGDGHAVELTRALLGYLTSHGGAGAACASAPQEAPFDPSSVVPSEARKVYDVRAVIGALVDGGETLEIAPRWARNMVTAFGRVDGRAVGFVANQPRHLGGAIDSDASQKAARFVRTCNSFGVPLVVLVDTPGFLPGTRQEAGGVIRHGAKLLYAFSEATVPRFTVVLRKAYGGGYITMNSHSLGADLVLAWPGAQIGVVGADQAVGILARREIAAADDPSAERARRAADYGERHLTAAVAAGSGFVDEIVAPVQTRGRLRWALKTIGAGERRGVDRGNVPL